MPNQGGKMKKGVTTHKRIPCPNCLKINGGRRTRKLYPMIKIRIKGGKLVYREACPVCGAPEIKEGGDVDAE